MRGVNKEIKKVFDQAKNNGWTIRRRRSGHYVIEGPRGEKVYCSGTSSDYRSVKNIKRDLAKAGLHLP